MRTSLRWKTLFVTAVIPLVLGLTTVLTVHRNVTQHVNSSSIHESLEHSVSVFESMLNTRSRALVGGAGVIVQDPRFFSLLMLGPSQRDSRFIATVKGMAHDFNRITQTQIFEVVDRNGRMLASVGASHSTAAARDSMVRIALRGRAVEGVLVERDSHYQLAVTPVMADGRVVGALLLGAQVGEMLARELRSQMRCEVTFLSGRTVTGTTLKTPGDLTALFRTLEELKLGPESDLAALGVIQVRSANDTWLTLVRRLPGASPEAQQSYVLQRSYDPETSFLHVMQRDMTMLAVIAVLLALLAGWMFSDQIVKPLQSLVRGAREMEAGNYEHPIPMRRGDEIGYLIERFVDMRQRERAYVNSLEQAARLKSEFISIASHELRTPISVLSGYRDILASGGLGPLTEKQKEALDKMRGFLARLTRVADDATQVAQVRGERLVLEFEPCEVEPLVSRAVGAALMQAPARSVKVEMKCSGIGEPVEADAESLTQAITQLVANGIRFTPDGGHVDVIARVAEARLRIEVHDNGVGIPADQIETMFERGLPIRESKHHHSSDGLDFDSAGLGMGLPMARSVAEAHGGALSVTSREGEGSTFVIEIPMAQPGEERAAA
jgi:signal transduction histidine kinase